MNNKQHQTGSSHLMIIIILVIALTGALGFVFWQNVIQKKADTSDKDISAKTESITPTVETKQEAVLSEIASDNLVGTNLAVKYPKTWTATNKDHSGVDAGTPLLSTFYTISSPDGSLAVKFSTTNVGRGGTCDAEPGRNITQLDKSNIPGFKKALFVSYSDNSGAFFAGIHENNEKSQSAKIGDSSCSIVTFGSLSGLMSGIPNSKSLNAGL